jgi:hypothetical protein
VRDLLVFTWNLNRNVEAAKLALRHLSSWPNDGLSWIAALQEPPSGIAAVLTGAGKVTVHGQRTRHNLILSSDDIVIDPDGPQHARNRTLDTNERTEGRTFASEHCLDQVLVSRDLAARPLVPVIRDRISGTSLVDAAGELLGKDVQDADGKQKWVYIYSDHLPVEMILPGEVVARACAA